MQNGPLLDMRRGGTTAEKLKEIRERAGLSMEAFAKEIGFRGGSSYQRYEDSSGYKKRSYLIPELAEKIATAVVGKGDPPISRREVMALAGIQLPAVDIHRPLHSQGTVGRRNEVSVASDLGKRPESRYEPLTEQVYAIGAVQAGAWVEAYQLPEEEWTTMSLPADDRFPGLPRYALRNVGESMNKVCRNGGLWIFIREFDLGGLVAAPGSYVIVQRKDGPLVEATAKRMEYRNGKPWLAPESTDESFKAFPLTSDCKVLGLVTDIVNRV